MVGKRTCHYLVAVAVQRTRHDAVCRTSDDCALSIAKYVGGVTTDGSLLNRHLRDGSLLDRHLRDWSLRDGLLSDGPLRDGSLRDGLLADGLLRDGSLRNGSLADGPLHDRRRATREGTLLDWAGDVLRSGTLVDTVARATVDVLLGEARQKYAHVIRAFHA